MILDDYLNLITSEHRLKPKFAAMVSFGVTPMIRIQDLLKSMIPIFDVDTAVGDQLDIVGKWAGISRNVSIPITGVYFSWDAGPDVGWEYGSWQDNLAPADITVLPDDAYRLLIKAKIAANRWDGTIESAYDIWDSIFLTTQIIIEDKQDMSYDLALIGGIIDSLTLALLSGGYIPLKPAGVRINVYYVSIDPGPVFGWDVDSPNLEGWDLGEWVREISPT